MSTEETVEKLWGDIEKTLLALGNPKNAKRLRNLYMRSDLTDERYEQIHAIVVADIRQHIEKIFQKYEFDPTIPPKMVKQRSRGPRVQKGNEPVSLRKNSYKKVGGFTIKRADKDAI